MLAHGEPEGLADDVVEGHDEEEAAQEEEGHAVDAVELAPLCTLFEQLVYLDCLTSFLNR